MNWLRKSVIWQAPIWRAILEGLAAGLLFIIALILVADELPDPTMRSGFFFSSVLSGTVAGFRARPAGTNFKKRILRFMLAAFSLGVLFLLGARIASLILNYPIFFQRTGVGEFEAVLMLLGSGIVYGCWRIFGILWRRWQYLRRTRFAWSLTAAFVNIIVWAAAFILLSVFIYYIFQPVPDQTLAENTSWAARFLRELAIFFFPQLVIFWFALLFTLFVTIPPLLLFSYYSTRKLTRRIEALADATRQLQSGDFSARTNVIGEDEVAQLQTVFNQMAENLQTVTNALQNERDKVALLLETQKEFTASISHELRTPVATLRAYLENNLTQTTNLPENIRGDLEIMLRETEQLQKLVDDLFTLAQTEVNQLSLNLQRVEPVPFLEDWVKKYRPVAWKNQKITLQGDIPPDLPPIRVDPQRLEQILNNLVQNAVRHTLPGGMVQIQSSVIDNKVRISVCDNGEGIPPDEIEHIWERYYRGKNHQHQGTGLGLALVKELAESMGGMVGVESSPGEGSHFWVAWKQSDHVSP